MGCSEGRERLPLSGKPGLHHEFGGWQVTPGQFNGLYRVKLG